MTIESLQSLATLVLLLSAATERLVEACKNLVPWLASPPPGVDGAPTPPPDRKRQLVVQLVTVGIATLIAAWVAAEPGEPFGAYLSIGTGSDTATGSGTTPPVNPAKNVRQIHVVVLALMTSGGSAFWNGILDFARAAAKLRGVKTALTQSVNTAIRDSERGLRAPVAIAVDRESGAPTANITVSV
jgi:hypothetical protein